VRAGSSKDHASRDHLEARTVICNARLVPVRARSSVDDIRSRRVSTLASARFKGSGRIVANPDRTPVCDIMSG
jgi:hypothetical protein